MSFRVIRPSARSERQGYAGEVTDRKDAERLANLLYLGEAPAVHVPPADVRTWREMITGRGRVIAKRTRAKNSLRAAQRSFNVVVSRR